MKKIVIPTALIAAAAAAWFFLAPRGGTPDTAAAAPATVEARKGSVSLVVEGAAIAEPFRQVALRTQSASVVTFAAREGSRLARGEVVVALDDAALRNTAGQMEILYSQAEVEALRSRLTRDRAVKDLADRKVLLDNKALSPGDYLLAEEAARAADLALETAELKVRQARLAADRAKSDLAESRIRAPFDGTVLKVQVSPGDLVGAAAQVALFGDIHRIRFAAEVDEFDIAKIAEGQAVTISGDSVGPEPIHSVVESVSPMAEIVNNISIFTVTAVVPNGEGRLRPGVSADFAILLRSDRGLVVPSKSVSTVRGRSYVDVMGTDGPVRKRVVTGADDGSRVVVLEGLEEGDLVVLPGAPAPGTPAAPGASGSEKSVLPITIPGTGGGR